MAARPDIAEYSIAAVSKLTGIGCHALRVWERRYGVPTPHRSASGHRRYSADQVRLLSAVARLLREGRALHDVMDEARAGALPAGELAAPAEARHLPLVDALLEGVRDPAEEAYRRAIEGLATADGLRLVIEPALIEVGERWFRGECDVFQEHLATGFLRRKLDRVLDSAQEANPRPPRTALVGAVQGDRHEGGVLIVCAQLELSGWGALSLGADLPVREIQKAADRWKPDAVCLSFALSRNINKRFAELARVRGTPIFVGGRSLLNYQGLARKHGLHPLVGPASEAIPRLIAQAEALAGARRASG